MPDQMSIECQKMEKKIQKNSGPKKQGSEYFG